MYFQGDTEAETSDALAREEELQKEAGDVLWQISGLCSVMGWSLDDIARQNLQKLADRQQRHVIDGSGDNR
jgi:NTP pyrophosphatase (non-canonical NTP hydrolase)